MKRMRVLSAMGAVVALLAGAAPKPKQLPLVPAKLWHLRDGLGNVFAKLEAGGEVRIAYIGGSVTAAGGWRVQTFDWLEKRYPKCKLVHINAAIGGTGSDLGVFRLKKDVIDKKPDLVFIEFSINDGSRKTHDVHCSVEGMVRQIWRADPTTDICMAYVWSHGYQKQLAKGMCARVPSAHERIAAHYGIPSINMALRIAKLIDAGKMVRKAPAGKAETEDGKMVYSHDGVHPRADTGHTIFTELIVQALELMAKGAKPMRHELKAPFTPDNWEQAKLVALEPWMLSSGWRHVDTSKGWAKRYAADFPTLWEADTPGEAIRLEFRGTALGLYDVIGPKTGKAIVTLDGKTHTLQRFDVYCIAFYRRHMAWVAKGLADQPHTVTIAVSPEAPDVRDAFKVFPEHAKKRTEAEIKGTALRIGYLMLVGEVIRN
jgi:lysophospholipase L1-like esterase